MEVISTILMVIDGIFNVVVGDMILPCLEHDKWWGRLLGFGMIIGFILMIGHTCRGFFRFFFIK